MSMHGASPASETSEEAREFLQMRVALFWKVMFFITLLSSGLGALGTLAEPGVDFLLTVALTFHAALFWWLARRGSRSIRVSRLLESGGLFINLVGGAFLGRYLYAGFARDHTLVTAEGLLMADGYVSMLELGGTSMMVAIRAALIPSSPRRTIVVSAFVGAPILLASALLVPTLDGGLALRPSDTGAYPWLPMNAAMMWFFAIITSTVISWVIYGLRAEVREARLLGQYILEDKIGEGGMGEVYRAHHGMMRRPSALKLLRAGRTGADNLRRFEREVQLTARLTHPNTITIFDYGRTGDGVFYYAMELLDGANLQRIVSVGGAQDPRRVVRILSMTCGALVEAHAIGLIHRDIKPANIMLCTQGGERDVVKLLDFGLVKELEVDRDVALTGANTITGTPQYMAPESILAPDTVDERTDIYALGAVAYYLLTGQEVFDGKSIVEVCSQHLHQAPAPLASHGILIPGDLEALILACLDKKPEARPQSAAEVRSRLEACAVEPWNTTHARSWWLAHQPALDASAVRFAHGTPAHAVPAPHLTVTRVPNS
jgi:hypothetical protein